MYAALGAPFATYLMTTYYRSIPTELVEASVMDGANYWQIFRKVMLPLSIPAITTVAVLQVIQIWDDLLVGLLFLQTPAVRTITVGLAMLQNGRVVNIPVLMAGSLVSALPGDHRLPHLPAEPDPGPDDGGEQVTLSGGPQGSIRAA